MSFFSSCLPLLQSPQSSSDSGPLVLPPAVAAVVGGSVGGAVGGGGSSGGCGLEMALADFGCFFGVGDVLVLQGYLAADLAVAAGC